MTEPAGRTNLLGMTRAGLEEFVAGIGAKPYRARQLLKWIYRRGEHDFSRMTDLARHFRKELAERAEVTVPEIVTARTATDGTRKWLLRMPGAAGSEQVIETIFIPEPGRGTLQPEPDRLRARLLVLRNRRFGIQPQPHGRRDHRAGLAREPRTRPGTGRRAHHHERRPDGHG
jgi:hypothetical protein